MKQLSFLMIAGMLFSIAACQIITAPATAVGVSTDMKLGGVPSLPYYTFSKEGLERLNRQMVEYQVPFTLADTSMAVYGTDFRDIVAVRYDEVLFTNMKEATASLHKLLNAKKIQNSENYILTSIDTALEDGYMLFAAVYRPELTITVAGKDDPSATRTLTPEDIEFYRPYRTDAAGEKLDTVYEWAALPVESYSRQARQAVLLTLTANQMAKRIAKPEYWDKEKIWMQGNYLDVAIEQDRVYTEFLGK
ncbi:MAG: hypothetical protein HF978_18695 [Desulfobacteraceae bacterium]|nr:hypothetical protein [Desulfobacteraceae bacterium]MBC2757576.1 hypothetical protein [Desulfobacteraceae bacterium]